VDFPVPLRPAFCEASKIYFWELIPSLGDYTRGDVSFSEYVNFAKLKAQEAIAIEHPSQESGYTQSCSGILLDPWTVCFNSGSLCHGRFFKITSFSLIVSPYLIDES
jgi:hypothetical protein